MAKRKHTVNLEDGNWELKSTTPARSVSDGMVEARDLVGKYLAEGIDFFVEHVGDPDTGKAQIKLWTQTAGEPQNEE